VIWRAILLVAFLQGCASAPKPLANAPKIELGPSPPGVSVRTSLRKYTITAASLRDIRRELARGPATFDGRRWAGVTNTYIRWNYQYRVGSGSCRLQSPRVELTVTITMPEWLPEGESDEDTKVWWHRYHAALFEHELGHGRIGIDAARRVARELDRGASGATCQELGLRVNARAEAILADLRKQQAAYDAETRHGGNQISAALAAPREP
jgi:predicted secreted Zn-dependent protease